MGDLKIKPVTEMYLGEPLSNSQGLGVRGAVSGGSKPTPQAQRMTTGSGSRSSKVTIPTSRPSNPQKLRG